MLQRFKPYLSKTILIILLGILMLSPIICFVLDGFEINFKKERFVILTISLFLMSLLYLIPQKKYFKNTFQIRFAIPRNTSLFMVTFLFLLIVPLMLGEYWLGVIILAFIYILLGLGLNIVVGLAGLLNLGFAAFYAIGAYTYAIGSEYFQLGFWTALPLAALISALFGVLLGFPVLRMVGDYLAIVTLGFGEIIRLILNNWGAVTGGPNGLSVPTPTFLGIEFTRNSQQNGILFHNIFNLEYDDRYATIFIYFVLLAFMMLTLLFITRLKQMPLGRAWEALREDEIACRSLGINHVKTKLSAFSLGAMIGGLGGVFFAALTGFVNPSSFTFVESALILSIVVLGGMGSTIGIILAALFLTLLPEMLRDFSEYRMLLFGVLMVLMMIWRPSGLIKMKRPKIERSK